eukprot:365070-Chlamydomonas_euryale.AAC.2
MDTRLEHSKCKHDLRIKADSGALVTQTVGPPPPMCPDHICLPTQPQTLWKNGRICTSSLASGRATQNVGRTPRPRPTPLFAPLPQPHTLWSSGRICTSSLASGPCHPACW